MNEAVFFEVQGTIRLAAVTGGGERRVVLFDETGQEQRLSRRKVLYTLAARVDATQASLEALKARLTRGSDPFDVELLWNHLEDARRYDLDELTRVYYDQVDDETVARLVAGLTVEGRVVDCIRLRKGYLQRLDAESLAHLRVARAREAKEQAEDDAFLAWFEPLRAEPPGGAVEAPPEHAAHLQILVGYALGGSKSDMARAGRRLQRRLDLKGPDEVLWELERVGVLPVHTNALPYRHRVPVEFRADARRAAQRLRREPAPLQGEDLRHLPTIAIDDPFTRDVDDAISAWEEDGALHVGVHIAHVAHAVPPGEALDAEARRRGSSLYFTGEVIPMLPWELSERHLSLVAGEARQAVSLIARVGASGLLEDLRFVESQVTVDCRVAYDEEGPPLAQTIKRSLAGVTKALRAAREARGAVILALPQVKFRLDEARHPYPAPVRQDTAAHRLVSELMVLYNAELGARLAQGRAPALYRVQPRAVSAPEGDPDDPLFPLTSRKGLPPTVISVEPGPHRTLGIETYVQGTSPIRRYGDLVAQRQLLALLAGEPPIHDAEDVSQIRQQLERTERRARTLEDERERYWVSVWLRTHDEPLQAYVSRLEPRRRLVYVPALRREIPCQLADEATVGDAVQVRPLSLDPKALRVACVS
jgi:exoribonuclease-2